MATTIGARASAIWRLIEQQHGVIARRQLLAFGLTAGAIRHRLATGRLHRVYTGVYAVGRPNLTRRGRWMAAVLACGPGAVLSHESAAALWRLRDHERGSTEVSVPRRNRHRRRSISVHGRHDRALETVVTHDGIPVTDPIRTIIDLAHRCSNAELEALVNQADKLELVDPETLRAELEAVAHEPGVRKLRLVLDRATFTLTDSELERRFLPIARRVGLPKPLTQRRINGFRVDFYWPELGLVVETDGLRYHRTPAQQARQALRDNAHLAAGLTPVRFTHAQIRYDPGYVESTLASVVSRVSG